LRRQRNPRSGIFAASAIGVPRKGSGIAVRIDRHCHVALATGAVVGLLSGGSPLRRAMRQLLIGYGAAAITYLLDLLFGTAPG